MTEHYRVERSGRRSWRIVRADGTTLPAWEYRSKAEAQGALRPAELEQDWQRYQQWVRVAMSDSWDEEDDA